MEWLNELVEKQRNEWQKELDKIKPIKKIQKFNKKNKDLLYQNNKLTTLGAYIIFLETYAFSEKFIKSKKGVIK